MRTHRRHLVVPTLLLALGFSPPATSQPTPPAPSEPDEAEAPQPMPEAVPLPPGAPMPGATGPGDTGPGDTGPGDTGPGASPPDQRRAPLDEPVAPRAAAPRLSRYELDMLDLGPISSGSHIGGGVLGTWIGFGIGHAVQGRYDEGGMIFTLGEAAALAMFATGLVNSFDRSRCFSDAEQVGGIGSGQALCDDRRRNQNLWTGMAVSGAVMFTIIRVWEIIDVWGGPIRHNAEYRRIRHKALGYRWGLSLTPVVLPNGGKMAVAGVRF